MRPNRISIRLTLAALSLLACSREAPPVQAIRQALQGTIPAAGGTVTGTTSGTSSFTGECSDGTSGAPEHVWAWTPSVSGFATVSTCGATTTYDTVLYVGAAADGNGQIACVDDDLYGCEIWNGESWGSRTKVWVNAGTTYYIYVDGYFNPGNTDERHHGDYTLTVEPPLLPTIPPGGGTIIGTTAGSGISTFAASCLAGPSSVSPERVYAWTPSHSGQATIHTCSPNTRIDTNVYVSTSHDGTGQIACDDDTPGCPIWNGQEWGTRLTVNVTAGTTYYIYVDSAAPDQTDEFSLTVVPPPPAPPLSSCPPNPQPPAGSNLAIVTNGYNGLFCIDSQCIQRPAGGVAGFTVSPGTHTIAAPWTNSPQQDMYLGNITIAADGTLTPPPPESSLWTHFDVCGPQLVARTVPVTFLFEGSPMSFALAGVDSVSAAAPTTRLLQGRSYIIDSNWAWDPDLANAWHLSPNSWGLTITPDGSAVVLDEGGAKRYFEQPSPLVLLPKWVDVSVDSDGFAGGVAFWGAGAAGPGHPTTRLLKGRKYWTGTENSWSLDRDDWLYSTAPDLTIVDNGTSPPTFDLGLSSSQYLTGHDATMTLKMKVVPVSVDFRGADTSSIDTYGLGAFTASGPPVRLQVGRRYALFTPWSLALDRNDSGVGAGYPAFSFGVAYDGNSVTVDQETGKHLQPVMGSAAARVVVSHVTIKPNGYGGSLCIPGVGCVQGSPGTLDVMAGRRYTIQGLGELSVISPTQCNPTSFGQVTIECAGDTTTATGVDVVIKTNGYVGAIAIDNGAAFFGPTCTTDACRATASVTFDLPVGSHRVVLPWTAPVTGPDNIDLTPGAQPLVVNENGTVTLGPQLQPFFNQVGPTTIEFKTRRVTLDMNGHFGGQLCWYYDCFLGPGSSTSTFVVGRRYGLGTTWAKSVDSNTFNLSNGWPLTVNLIDPQLPPLALDDETKRTLSYDGNLTLTGRTAEIEFFYRGHPLGVGANGVNGVTPPHGTVKLLAGRRYQLVGSYSDWHLDADTHSISTEGDQFTFRVIDENTVAGDDAVNAHFEVAGKVVKAKVARVTVAFPGSTQNFCISGILCSPDGSAKTMDLMVGRRYEVQGVGKFSVALDGSCNGNGLSLGGHALALTCNLESAACAGVPDSAHQMCAGDMCNPSFCYGGQCLESPSGSCTVTADAGPDRATGTGNTITLFGGGSTNPPGGALSYNWTQIDGPTVTLTDAHTAQPTFITPSVPVLTDLTFSLVVTNSLTSSPADLVTVVVLPRAAGRDLTPLGSVMAKVTQPLGAGNPNPGVIRDGVRPPIGSTDRSRQFDSSRGDYASTEDWIGYDYGTTTTFDRLVFQEGVRTTEGGWFQNLSVQVRQGQNWVAIPQAVITPAYPGNGSGQNYAAYQIDFPSIAGSAVRLYGVPGGGQNDRYVSTGELRVLGSTTTSQAVQLVAEHSGKCLQLDVGTASQQRCSATVTGQQWLLKEAATGYQFVSPGNQGFCLGGPNPAGQDLVLVNCGLPEATWKLQPDGKNQRLVTSVGGLCADVESGSTLSGTRVLVWGCSGNSQQRWTIRPVPDNECDGVPDLEHRACGDEDPCNPRECRANRCQAAPVQNPSQCVSFAGTCSIQRSQPSDVDIVYAYENKTKGENIRLAPGPTNHFNEVSAGIGSDRGQPRMFPPGRGAFRTHLQTGVDTWTLGTGNASGTASTAPCTVSSYNYDQRVVIGGQPYTMGIDETTVLAFAEGPTSKSRPGESSAEYATGATPGSLSVSHSGSANYSIPILMPPGPGGFIPPRLSIDYTSDAGNGLLGVGFMLTGVSKIERCPRTDPFLDSETWPVEWDEPAAEGHPYGLCLDGKKLIPVETAPPIKTYRLFDDPSITVKVKDSDATGPLSFDLFDGDGNVQTYGGTAESRLQNTLVRYEPGSGKNAAKLGNDAVLSWAVSSIRNRFGVTATYGYDKEAHAETQDSVPFTAVEQRIRDISYGRTKMTFGYEARSDTTDRYVRGFHTSTTRRLTSIDVHVNVIGGDTVARKYVLTYEASLAPLTKRSRLGSIQECDGKGVCRVPISFKWQEESVDFRPEEPGVSLNDFEGEFGRVSHISVVDLNNDGKDDIILRTGTEAHPTWSYALSNGSNLGALQSTDLPPGVLDLEEEWSTVGGWVPPVEPPWVRKRKFRIYDQLIATDLDGDGKPELAMWDTSNGVSGFKFFNVDVTNGHATPFLTSLSHVMPYIADLNGDGLPEVITKVVDVGWKVKINQASNPGTFVLWDHTIPGSVLPDLAHSTFEDIDGDGRLELLGGAPDNFENYRSFVIPRFDRPQNYSGFGQTYMKVPVGSSAYSRALSADLNGDGLLDHLTVFSEFLFGLHAVGDDYLTFFYQQNTGNGVINRSPPPIGDKGDGAGEDLYRTAGLGVPVGGQPAGIGLPPVVTHFQTEPNDDPTVPIWQVAAPGTHGTRYDFIDSGVRVVDLDGDGKHELLVTGLPPVCLHGSWVTTDTATRGWGVLKDGSIGPFCRDIQKDPTLGQPYTIKRSPDGTWAKELVPGVDFSPPVVFDPTHPAHMLHFGAKLNTVLDIDGDGLPDLLQTRATGPFAVYLQVYRRRVAKKADLLIEITNSLGAKTSVEYAPISDPAVHTAATSSCWYPFHCDNRGRWLVRKVTRDTGVFSSAGEERLEELHSYVGGRSEMRHHSWLGFDQHIVEQPARGAKTTYEFFNTARNSSKNVYYLAGKVSSETTDYNGFASTAVRVRKDWTYSDLSPEVDHLLVRPTKICESKFEVPKPAPPPGGGTPVIEWGQPYAELCHTYTNHDSWGIPQVTGTSGGLDQRSVTTTYAHIDDVNATDPNARRRILGIPQLVTETSTVRGMVSPERKVKYVTDANGMVSQEIVEPTRSGTLHRETIFVRDALGQPTSVTISGTAAAADPVTGQVHGGGTATQRTTEYEYDDSGHVRRILNPRGHAEEFVYDPRHGGLVAHRDANGLLTRQVYDGLGRVIEKIPATEAHEYIDYTFGLGGLSRVEVKHQVPGGTLLDRSAVYHNKLDQPVIAEKAMPRGKTQFSTTSYDVLGRAHQFSVPTLDGFGADPKFTTRNYDALDRLTSIVEPDGVQTLAIDYDKLKSTSRNGLNKRHVVNRDASGLILTSQNLDSGGAVIGQVTMTYGFFGQLENLKKQLGGPVATDTAFGYDHLGRRTSSTDPDRGTLTSVPNSFGEVVHQLAPGAGVETKYFDELGRTELVENSDGSTQFSFDRAPGGIGQVNWSASPDGVETTNTFDSFGRPSGSFVLVPSAAGPATAATFATETWYDSAGRMGGIKYPEAAAKKRFEVTYEYSTAAGGTLMGARDGVGKSLWRAEDFNAFGDLAQERFGNGFRVKWTEASDTGLLKSIQGGFTAGAAANEFDLTVPGLPSTLVQDLAYSYDDARNLEARKDHGRAVGGQGSNVFVEESYGYDDLNRLKTWLVQSPNGPGTEFTYPFDDYGNLKGRVSSSGANEWSFGYGSSRPHAVMSATASGQARSYGYDPQGRRSSDAGRTVTYTWFDLPKQILIAQQPIATFSYDADHGRVRKVGQGSETITIGLYERRAPEFAPQDSRHIYRVQGPGRVVAEVEWDSAGAPAGERYLHTDRLESVELVTGSNGEITRQRYEPYGNAVNPANPIETVTPSVGGGTRHGFTGHEHDDELGYINMTGRIYDPISASFLTSDPIISHPAWAHAIHPYSYVVNNPVNKLDPTGFGDQDAGAGSSGVPCGDQCEKPGATGVENVVVEEVREDENGVPYDVTLYGVQTYVVTETGGHEAKGPPKVKAVSVKLHTWQRTNTRGEHVDGDTCVGKRCVSNIDGGQYEMTPAADRYFHDNNGGIAIQRVADLVVPQDPLSFAALAVLPGVGKLIERAMGGAAVVEGAELLATRGGASNSIVYQLVDEAGDAVYYGKTRMSQLADTVRRHAKNPTGPWHGLQVISEQMAEHQALNLETSLIQSAIAEGRTIYNVAPRSISAAKAEAIAAPRTIVPDRSILNPRVYPRPRVYRRE